MFNYGAFFGPYFAAFGLNRERYRVSLRNQSEYGIIQTRKISVFGHFSHKATNTVEDCHKGVFRTLSYSADKSHYLFLQKHFILDVSKTSE